MYPLLSLILFCIRSALEPRLARFLESYPSDPECHRVQVWLAWIRIGQGKFDAALALADQASVEKVGSTFDAAQVVRAAVSTRRGHPDTSLSILEPLSGQIVDSRERDTWAREIIRAALTLKHDDDALKWALVWRLESSEDRRTAIDGEIGLVLDQVSRLALDRLWNVLIAAEQMPTTSQVRRQGRLWMREAVLQRLARYAVDARDGDLARRLLNDAWLPLQKSSTLKRLTRVASQGQIELQNLTRSIGVVLELDDSESRRRSSEFVTGVLQTLDQIAGQPPVRLRTREALSRDKDGYAEAAEDLYNEGVAILIGGFEAKSAIELATKARDKKIPAIVLSQLPPTVAGEFSFWFDVTDQTVVERWLDSNVSNGDAAKVITALDPVCSSDEENVLAQWRDGHVERVLVNSGPVCAEKLGQSALDATRLPAIWLGPKSVSAADAFRPEQIKGHINFERLLDAKDRAPGLAEWQKRLSRLPSYYEVLGHDVALLSAVSLQNFPSSVAPDVQSRNQALQRIADGLSNAQASLWSTRSRGFGAKHSIVPAFELQSGAPSDTQSSFRRAPRPERQ